MDRVRPTPDCGEFDMLAGWLAFHRAILLHKTNGLSDEQSRLCHPPSELTILGLVRHLAETERWWFRMIFAGEDIEPRWCDDSDRDRDFHVTSGDTLAEAVAAYREECDASDLIIARSKLDQRSAQTPTARTGKSRVRAWASSPVTAARTSSALCSGCSNWRGSSSLCPKVR